MNQEKVKMALDLLLSSEQGSNKYEVAAFALYMAMSGTHLAQLAQLVNVGPVEDGDVLSKSARNDLMDWGLASRVCVGGEQGYTGANYRGWDVFKAA